MPIANQSIRSLGSCMPNTTILPLDILSHTPYTMVNIIMSHVSSHHHVTIEVDQNQIVDGRRFF